MNRNLLIALLGVGCALLLVRAPAVSSHKLPDYDPIAPLTYANTPRGIIIEYFTASKNADAARASSLINYDALTKRMGLEGEAAKEWVEKYRVELERAYRSEKAAGSTKEFEIVKEAIEHDTAVFEVTQDRAGGLYRWQVTAAVEGGRWALVDFALRSVARH